MGAMSGQDTQAGKQAETDVACTAWVCRPGTGEQFKAGFLASNVCALGWGVGDLRGYASPEDIVRQNPTVEGVTRSTAGELWRFRAEVQVGDVVVTPYHEDYTRGEGVDWVAIGLVVGVYHYDAGTEQAHQGPDGDRSIPGPHLRRVHWLVQHLPIDRVPSDFHNHLHGRASLVRYADPTPARRFLEVAEAQLEAEEVGRTQTS